MSADEFRLGKRDRGELGDLVKDVLQEDLHRKAQKTRKSVTINEEANVQHIIPAVVSEATEEEGPIKEHLIELAHQQRQDTRKGQGDAALAAFDAGEDAEEDQELEQLDGHTLEAFNMRDEREHGYIDDDGAFVERKDKEEEELRKDAWLASAEVVSDAVKERLKRQQAQAAAAETPISDEEVARAKAALSELMEPRETVMQALQRVSARPKGHTGKQRVGRHELTPEERQRKERIEKLTEAASTIMAAGETDIYEQRKEELQHASALVLPTIQAEQEADPSTIAAADGGQDMFADSDDEQPAPTSNGHATAPPAAAGTEPSAAAASERPEAAAPPLATSAEQAGPPPANGQPAAQSAPSVDYSEWPISELRRVLTEAGVSIAGVTEKAELIERAKRLDEERAMPQVPAGFVLEPSSGYFVNAEWGMYYDAQSGCYFKDGRWMTYDSASGRYLDLPSGAAQN